MTKQLAWFIGLITCMCGALIGQAEMISEPWRHWITILFVMGTAASGYMMRPGPWDGEERRDK